MSILDKKLIEEACSPETQKDRLFDNVMDFKAGIEWAESQMEDLAIEFADWITINYFSKVDLIRQEVISYSEKTTRVTFKKSKGELFEQFLKERDEGA